MCMHAYTLLFLISHINLLFVPAFIRLLHEWSLAALATRLREKIGGITLMN